jgi:hypothetical protein
MPDRAIATVAYCRYNYGAGSNQREQVTKCDDNNKQN